MRYGYIYSDGSIECPSRLTAKIDNFNPRYIDANANSEFAGIVEVTDEDIIVIRENGFDFNETIEPLLNDPDKFDKEYNRIY